MRESKIPLSIYALAFAICAQGTSELMLSGLLPAIASDLDVSLSSAGLLASGFAVGMAVGAPMLTVATLGWPRRHAMLAFLAAFVATHVVGAMAPSYEVLMVSRVLGAIVYAGFWVVAIVSAVSLVPPQLKGRALAIVAGGLTIATIVGVPAGTVLGQQFGWRATVWAVAVLTAVSAIGILATAPRDHRGSAPRPQLRRELEALGNPRLWLAYVATAMSSGQAFATFTFVGALLIEVSSVPESWVPAALVVSGVGSLLGLVVGGRTSDRWPFATLAIGFGGAAITALLLFTTAAMPIPAILLSAVLQFFAFATNPAVNVRVFTLAANAPNLAGAGNITGFNIGIIVGPALSAALIDNGFGLAAVAWASAGMAVVGLAATGWSYALRHKDPHGRETGDEAEALPLLASSRSVEW
ncbi:Cmx/CmrA family chloramphenicol efflux MFS transporter [Mycobacterium sp.]|uniref:Cmx/CmrA family chloramphenicol efflux MFS transporter n=1 Tax=Mycobacterium sp. TaxID=1785 RepID=UPI002DA11713|nr:Cmx/CmrA family chloramphenicol efflux MFS transporter [Mycobacterium sp.]